MEVALILTISTKQAKSNLAIGQRSVSVAANGFGHFASKLLQDFPFESMRKVPNLLHSALY